MKVRELIKELKERGLDVHDEYALESKPPYVALYYSEKMHGSKFLELVIPSDRGVKEKAKEAEFTRVKFHKETVSPTSLLEFIEKTRDDGPITKRIKVENCSNEDSIEIAISSYNVVKELCQFRKK